MIDDMRCRQDEAIGTGDETRTSARHHTWKMARHWPHRWRRSIEKRNKRIGGIDDFYCRWLLPGLRDNADHGGTISVDDSRKTARLAFP
ncbi:hypothetical protein [Paraburkholderia piptadeniae]|uniref:hypothetical protein n=1 Tax=Paraburkholderia piptadeniae TaxID=1701573 RepID=UPI001F2CCD2F|nr:hypothetical protein [Paraburkholderia piptadeniae]